VADFRKDPYVEQLVRGTMSMSMKFAENAIYLMDNVRKDLVADLQKEPYIEWLVLGKMFRNASFASWILACMYMSPMFSG